MLQSGHQMDSEAYKLAATGVHKFDPPSDPGDGNDWVLVLERGG